MRYSRQEILPEIGKQGQEKFKNSSILVLGVGGLGSICAEILTRAGIGKLILIDNDKVELSNLQRQSLFDEKDVGNFKTDATKEKLNKINKEIEILPLKLFFNTNTIALLEKEDYAFDLAIDCTDNLYTRFLLNDYCKKYNIPLIFGSAAATKGMAMSITKESSCFNCTFENKISFDDCETVGILSTTNHMVASLQATLAMQILLGKKINSDLLVLDAWNATLQKIKVQKRASCKTCSKNYEYLDGKKQYVVGYCKSKDLYAVDVGLQLPDIKKIKNITIVEKTNDYTKIKCNAIPITIHAHGRIEFFTKNKDSIAACMKTLLGENQ